MATYRKADKEAEVIVKRLLKTNYIDIAAADVTLEILFAYAPRNEATGEPLGPALKHANWPAAATIKVNSLKDRVAGCADARICVDGDKWPDWPEATRVATLDHELMHLELRRDEEGAILLDDANRPKLRLRPHDFQLGGFDQIIKLHGAASFEAMAAIDLNRRLTQMEFSWG